MNCRVRRSAAIVFMVCLASIVVLATLALVAQPQLPNIDESGM